MVMGGVWGRRAVRRSGSDRERLGGVWGVSITSGSGVGPDQSFNFQMEIDRLCREMKVLNVYFCREVNVMNIDLATPALALH